MQFQRKVNLAIVVILAFFLIGTIVYSVNLRSSAAVDKPAPDFQLPESEDDPGKTLRLSDFRGRFVVMNMWASWCPPCREEAPVLQTFANRYQDRIVLLGINWREPWRMIREYKQQFDISFLTARDADGMVAREYGLRAVPETWFIDELGIARYHHIGPLRFEQLQELVARVSGQSLDRAEDDPLKPDGVLIDMAVDRHGTLWINSSKGLYRLPELGNWENIPFAPGMSEPLLLSRSDDGDVTIRLAEADGTLWELSWDRDGADWRQVGHIGDGEVETGEIGSNQLIAESRGLIALTLIGEEGLAWHEQHGLLRSHDRGKTWSVLNNVSTDLPGSIHGITIMPERFGKAILAYGERGVWRSDDEGKNWRHLSLNAESYDPNDSIDWDPRFHRPVHHVVFHESEEGVTMLLATEIGLWTSQDGGQSLHRVPGSPFRTIRRIAVDREGNVWIGTPNGDVYRAQGPNYEEWILWNVQQTTE